jgi:hypothetical protein
VVHRILARHRIREVYSRSHDAVIRVYDDAGNVIDTHEHTGDFKEWQSLFRLAPRNGWRDNSPRHAMTSTAIDPGGKRIIQILSAFITDFSVDEQ